MANWYSGVLNTGKRRYGHPALNGVLPFPWLPRNPEHHSAIDGPSNPNRSTAQGSNTAVVVTLRKRRSNVREGLRWKVNSAADQREAHAGQTDSLQNNVERADDEGLINPWNDPVAGRTSAVTSHRRLSYDPGSGVIVLPDSDHWLTESDSDSDQDVSNETYQRQHTEGDIAERSDMHRRHSIYFHRPAPRTGS